MRTPREILFERHGSADAKLDKIRRNVLENMASRRGGEADAMAWPEFLSSIRWHLAGLSAAWLVVVLLSVNHSADGQTAQTRKKMPSARQLVVEVRENRRLVQELTGAAVVETGPALPSPHSSLRPSSFRKSVSSVV
jgi:hypothetical protein